jgi:hypothetical protein
MLMLVGDNAFQGVSHLSQEKARERVSGVKRAEYCADLLNTAIDNDAEGFMFTVTENTLSILRVFKTKYPAINLRLYAIIPSAVDYVRISGQSGMEGLAKTLSKKMVTSGNITAVYCCLKGLAQTDIEQLLRGLLSYQISEINSVASKNVKLEAVLLHELLCDMALALNLQWVFDCFIEQMQKLKVKPGFQTRNFALLVKKLAEWKIDVGQIVVVAPFNSVGFQMSPSREDCEQVLTSFSSSNVIAINVLASGYLNLYEAAEYIKKLPNITGLAVGISKEMHALETFKLLREKLDRSNV